MVKGHDRAWKWGAALGLVMAMAAPGVGQDAAIDFGDDSSRWANNGVCDDPRFAGEGAARLLLSSDLGRDATDCQAALEAGTVAYVGDAEPEPDPAPTPAPGPDPESETPPPLPTDPDVDGPAEDDADAAEIDFGDDTSPWANDGECDDPRFEGEGASANTTAADLGRDATDCQAAFEAGTVTYLGEPDADEGVVPPPLPGTPPSDPDAAEIDFGDDSGGWPNDGECDDPRFEGEAVASYLDPANVRGDASDCRAAFEAGTATYIGEDHLTLPTTDRIVEDGIDFGLDTSTWANDGECDDPRFEGEGAASMRYDYNIQADATDCVAAYRDGTVTYLGEPDEDAAAPDQSDQSGEPAQSLIVDGIDFGDDTGQWANDGECDDPRFEGEAMAFSPTEDHRGRDASDCVAAYGEGTIRLIVPLSERAPANLDKIVHGRTPETANIHFGSDTSRWAHDGECDDPRFEGEGAAKTRLEQDMFADATDCRNAVEAGTVVFTP